LITSVKKINNCSLRHFYKFDEKDSTSVDTEVPDYTQNLNDSIQGLTIGLPKEFFAEGLDDHC
jgi:Asp-tRNA(Asn)/Glu-tRNA(Gln) amidotransferase A subunit family amidase